CSQSRCASCATSASVRLTRAESGRNAAPRLPAARRRLPLYVRESEPAEDDRRAGHTQRGKSHRLVAPEDRDWRERNPDLGQRHCLRPAMMVVHLGLALLLGDLARLLELLRVDHDLFLLLLVAVDFLLVLGLLFAGRERRAELGEVLLAALRLIEVPL